MKIKNYINFLKNKEIHVIGVSGAEGAAIALFLVKHKIQNFHLNDFSREEDFKKNFYQAHSEIPKKKQNQIYNKLLRLKSRINFRKKYLKNIKKADLIFVPQSWHLYKENDSLKKLVRKINFSNLTKLYFDLCSAKIIGITGSNGKTTTANLINTIFRKEYCSEGSRSKIRATKDDRKVYFSGNDRTNIQILDKIEKIKEKDWLILEISNRQLKQDLGRSPGIGVITNITPNHLNEYRSFSEYIKAKESLLKYQDKTNWAVLNWDDPVSLKLIKSRKYNVFGFSFKKKLKRGCFIENGKIIIRDKDLKKEIYSIKNIKLRGQHNLANILAAVAVAYLVGINKKTIFQAVKNFSGLKKRLELVKKVKGIEFYDNTSSTTPESTIAAINSFKENKILIVGGRNKNLDLSKLAEEIVKKINFLIILKSPLGEEIKSLVLKKGLDKSDIYFCPTLSRAVKKSFDLARKGDVVIFSPSGEYFCYFKGKMKEYKDFGKLVKKLSL